MKPEALAAILRFSSQDYLERANTAALAAQPQEAEHLRTIADQLNFMAKQINTNK